MCFRELKKKYILCKRVSVFCRINSLSRQLFIFPFQYIYVYFFYSLLFLWASLQTLNKRNKTDSTGFRIAERVVPMVVTLSLSLSPCHICTIGNRSFFPRRPSCDSNVAFFGRNIFYLWKYKFHCDMIE